MLTVYTFTVALLNYKRGRGMDIFIAGSVGSSYLIDSLSGALSVGSCMSSLSFVSLSSSSTGSFVGSVGGYVVGGSHVCLLSFFKARSIGIFSLSKGFLFVMKTGNKNPKRFFHAFSFSIGSGKVCLLSIQGEGVVRCTLSGSFERRCHCSNGLSKVGDFFMAGRSGFMLKVSGRVCSSTGILLMGRRFRVVRRVLPFGRGSARKRLGVNDFEEYNSGVIFCCPISSSVCLFRRSNGLNGGCAVPLGSRPVSSSVEDSCGGVITREGLNKFGCFRRPVCCGKDLFLAAVFCNSSGTLFYLSVMGRGCIVGDCRKVVSLFGGLSVRSFGFPMCMSGGRVMYSVGRVVCRGVGRGRVVSPTCVAVLGRNKALLLICRLGGSGARR